MTCKELNKNWKKRASDIQDTVTQFENAVQTSINIFGEKNVSRLWLSSSNTYRSQFNRAILDVMVFYFSDEIIRQAAEENKVAVEEAFKELCSSNSGFREAIEGTTKNIRETHIRLSLWGRALLEVLDVKFNVPELVDNRIIFNGLR
jgi:predicted nucleotide-binding protein (sugar kinase/HSP70/actin superfamily)